MPLFGLLPSATISSPTGGVVEGYQQVFDQFISLDKFGAVLDNATDNAALINTIMGRLGGSTGMNLLYIPPKCYYSPANLTFTNANTIIIDAYNGQVIFGKNQALRFEGSGGSGHMTLRSIVATLAARYYLMPNGTPSGTKSKIDLFADDYSADATNYRVNTFTYYDDETLATGGYGMWAAKAVGGFFGAFPSMRWGFSDGAAGAAEQFYANFAAAWYAPMRGMWKTGTTYAAGDYCVNANKVYQTAAGGVSGATAPTHTSGSASDGGVTWTFILDSAATSSHIKPVIVYSQTPGTLPKLGTSLEGYPVQWASAPLHWNGAQTAHLGNGNTAVKWLVGSPSLSDDYYITSQGTNGGSVRLNDKFMQLNNMAFLLQSKSFTGGETSGLDITTANLVTLGNGSATSITSFTASPYQMVIIQAGTNNNTLVNGASIVTSTGQDLAMKTGQPAFFIANGAGTVLTQIGQTPGQTLQLLTYTLATVPAASTLPAGKEIYITDFGNGGSKWYTDGTYWHPVGNQALISVLNTQTAVPADTTEDTLLSVTIPKALVSPNMQIEVRLDASCTNNANAKTLRVRYSTAAGTQILNQAMASVTGYRGTCLLSWRNSTSAQEGIYYTSGGGLGTNTGANGVTTLSVASASADTTLVITGQKATAGDSMALESAQVWWKA